MLASETVSGGYGFDYTIEQLGSPKRASSKLQVTRDKLQATSYKSQQYNWQRLLPFVDKSHVGIPQISIIFHKIIFRMGYVFQNVDDAGAGVERRYHAKLQRIKVEEGVPVDSSSSTSASNKRMSASVGMGVPSLLLLCS